MIQDITPHRLDNQYKNGTPTEEDYLLIFEENNILLGQSKEGIEFPKQSDLPKEYLNEIETYIFLFSIDDRNYYYVKNNPLKEWGQWNYVSLQTIRTLIPTWKAFAAALGVQLHQWYQDHQYCGRCGSSLVFHESERALQCPHCSNTVYPTLSPSVIVAITNGNKLLLTKYAFGAYKNYALVAGYAEVGEGLEETVRREVMEEVGLKVKNITYYKTQPWPFSGSLLVGYFAELDGEDKVTLQESELSEATWFEREDIPEPNSTISLTSEMILLFKHGESEIK